MTQGKTQHMLDRKLRRMGGGCFGGQGYPSSLGIFCIKPLMPITEKNPGVLGNGYSKGGF